MKRSKDQPCLQVVNKAALRWLSQYVNIEKQLKFVKWYF